jgi:O-6-methylguanine DNA methyltransferase
MSTRPDEEDGVGAMTREGGRQVRVGRPVAAHYVTRWGVGTVTVCDGRLVAVELPEDGPIESVADAKAGTAADQAALERWVAELEAYFRGERLGWTADEVGVDDLGLGQFYRRVYSTLLEVPPGAMVSYGELADRAGFPRAARAVGTAMATNPIPVVIPCHRVIRSDGKLGNYGNDPGWKARLLEHERSHVVEREDE